MYPKINNKKNYHNQLKKNHSPFPLHITCEGGRWVFIFKKKMGVNPLGCSVKFGPGGGEVQATSTCVGKRKTNKNTKIQLETHEVIYL